MQAIDKSARAYLWVGLVSLTLMSVTAIVIAIEAGKNAEWVTHTTDVLKKNSDTRVNLRRTESAAHVYALGGGDSLIREFEDAQATLADNISQLKQMVKDNDAQFQRLARVEPHFARWITSLRKLVQLRKDNDIEGIAQFATRRDDDAERTPITSIFDEFTSAEQRLLKERLAQSQLSSSLLLGVELSALASILFFAALFIRHSSISSRALIKSLAALRVAKSELEAETTAQHKQIEAAQEQIRRSALVLQNTFNSMAEAVLVIDMQGEVLLSNPAAGKLLGHRPGMSVNDIWLINSFCDPDTVTPFEFEERPSTRLLRGRSFDQKKVLIRHCSGTSSLVLVSGRPLRDDNGTINGASMVFHDITEAHEIELQLRQSQKLDAIGKLTGGVAHDFNNMLTVITGTVEILKESVKTNGEALAIANLIDRAADRCTELIRHLLAFARKQPLRPRNVDVNSTIADIAKLLRPTIGEQIEINVDLGETVDAVHIDPSQLANALVNMAINSRDAMPMGGKLQLQTRNIHLDDAFALTNPGVEAGHYVQISVSDNGTGMSPEVLKQAFEPFFTTKISGKGTGLGLSMVHGFANQSGGHVKIISEQGRGTTIHLYLPVAHAVAEETEVSSATAATGGVETIFVVEDDDLVRGFVTEQLRDLGYATIEAASPLEALSRIENGVTFDLLFTDVIMPGMNGKVFADEVERLRPGIRVLFTSGYTNDAVIPEARLDQNALLLSKPYRRSELAHFIRATIDGPAYSEHILKAG